MNTNYKWLAFLSLAFCLALLAVASAADTEKAAAETKLEGPQGAAIMVRMQGPYDAEVPLQIVCYFKRTAMKDKNLNGAPVELDKRLGGLIEAVRERGEFNGEEQETFLIDAPEGTIKAKKLLLIGLGDGASLSLSRMEHVGRTALREAVRLKATEVAFAPLIKDAGNNLLPAGEVEANVIRGMLLAYATEQQLQQEGFAEPYTLKTWIIEAGPTYYQETITGAKKGIAEAAEITSKREPKKYSTKSK